MKSISNERICELMDGHDANGLNAQALDGLLADPEAVHTWHAYHVIGDVLRSAELAPSSGDQAFLKRLERRLAQEPVRPAIAERNPVPVAIGLSSANASIFRWKMFSAVASVALVGVLGVNMWGPQDSRGELKMAVQGSVATTAATNLVTTGSGERAMLRDPHLDELMAAHRQMGGQSALHVPAGFVRNANLEGPAR